MTKVVPTVLRWPVTLGLLGLVLWWVDLPATAQALQSVALPWLLLALAITPFQVAMSAWRWRYTVARLGARLPLGHAIGEYYLATLVNQLAPGGVVGDAGRALRHRRSATDTMLAIHGVMIERLSGQLVLLMVAVPLLMFWLPGADRVGSGLMPAFVLSLIALALWLLVRTTRLRRWWQRFREDLLAALLNRQALPVQVLSSLLVTGSYLLVFWCLAMGLGYDVAHRAPWLLLALCTVLLMAMVVPLTVAGWGVREGVAAVLWPLAGLEAEQGVALSICYGLLVLVSSLPGGLFLFAPENALQTRRLSSGKPQIKQHIATKIDHVGVGPQGIAETVDLRK